MMSADKRLFLLDAYALIYRAYFAFSRNPLINSKGMNVSAISGFTSTLYDLIQKEKPTHLAVVFDAPEQTERATQFEFYKANRQEMPEDIAKSIPYIKQIIKGFHIPMLELAGYEADDIIGTIAKRKAAEDHVIYMVTPDKDYGQLVDKSIFIYKPGRQGNETEILGVQEILNRWEIDHPRQVIDILALMGDSVDNIPGIPGVGEKTAKKLIKEFGSLEAVIERASELKGKLAENIKQYAEQGRISKHLATIVLDVPIDVSDEDLLMSEPDKAALAEIFAELEFRTLGKRILGDTYSVNSTTKPESNKGQFSLFGDDDALPEQPIVEKGKNIQNTPHSYHCLNTEKEWKELAEKLLASNEFCFDTETTSLDYLNTELVGLSFSIKAHEAYYIPCPENKDQTNKILEIFRPAFESKTLVKIGQNIKFDWHVLNNYGITVSEPFFDTMLAHYLAEPDLKHNMDYLSESYLGYTPVSIEELIGKKGKNQGNMREVDLATITEYAAEDADITLQLKSVMQKLIKEREVESVLEKIEMPLMPVLASMEREGVKVDEEFLRNYSSELTNEIIGIRNKIYEQAGQEFNIDSPKQLGEILFDKLKLPGAEKTKTGQYATGEDKLLKLGKEFPIVHDILDYREIAKLKSTYVDALPQLINPRTGRVHTTFNQTIAATGRLSSINPNLQNIPIKTDKGQQVRKAFVARNADYVLISADYSQIELRLVAELSGDEAMLEAFRAGHDIHQATAAKVYGVGLNDVTKAMRSNAKMVNFGIIYAISSFGLSQRLGIPKKEAAELIENYFKTYPAIKQFMNDTLEFARQNGYVKTIMGRRRYLKDINSRNFTVRGFAEREAINSPVQGSAADLIKIAMINIQKEIENKKLKSRMTLQVHDELIFDAHRDEVELLKPIIIHNMQNALKTKVPLVAEVGVGTNWLEAH
jgi:DNA polymerase-1